MLGYQAPPSRTHGSYFWHLKPAVQQNSDSTGTTTAKNTREKTLTGNCWSTVNSCYSVHIEPRSNEKTLGIWSITVTSTLKSFSALSCSNVCFMNHYKTNSFVFISCLADKASTFLTSSGMMIIIVNVWFNNICIFHSFRCFQWMPTSEWLDILTRGWPPW